jgi:hypothetical protein
LVHLGCPQEYRSVSYAPRNGRCQESFRRMSLAVPLTFV